MADFKRQVYVWRTSPTGHLLHRVDQTGKSACGRSFDPTRLSEPFQPDTAKTLPYCAICLRIAERSSHA
jgi:hypothetical protein